MIITTAAFLLLTPVSALAGGKSAADCNDAACEAWQSGVGAKPGAPTTCLVTITAPTYGGKIGLEVRDANRDSRWKAPRIKHVGAGTVVYRIGCGWLEEPTAEVYLCVEGKDGKKFTSIRWRAKGDLDDTLKTRRLEMCLKGQRCPRFVAGEPPKRR